MEILISFTQIGLNGFAVQIQIENREHCNYFLCKPVDKILRKTRENIKGGKDKLGKSTGACRLKRNSVFRGMAALTNYDGLEIRPRS